MESRTRTDSAFRGQRTKVGRKPSPGVKGPVGPDQKTVQSRSTGYGSMFENVKQREPKKWTPKTAFVGSEGPRPESPMAQQQAQALEAAGQQEISGMMPQMLPQGSLQSAYNTGGFDGVSQVDGWYDVPDWQRTSMLAGLTR